MTKRKSEKKDKEIIGYIIREGSSIGITVNRVLDDAETVFIAAAMIASVKHLLDMHIVHMQKEVSKIKTLSTFIPEKILDEILEQAAKRVETLDNNTEDVSGMSGGRI